MVQFRVKALNQLQKPDDLDILMKVTKLRGWLGLATLAAAVTAAIVWAFVGSLPAEVKAEGLLSKPEGVTVVQSNVSGQILAWYYVDGQTIKPGHPIAKVLLPDGSTTIVRSRWGGFITGNPIDVGNYIQPGSPLMYIERDIPNNHLLAFLFVDSAKATGIAPGMKVDLNVASAPAAAFGVLRARVTDVAPYPATFAEVENLFSDTQLAKQFTAKGLPTIVTVDFQTDPKTPSGFKWSTKSGPPFPLRSGIQVKATVIQGTQAPIKLVFGK